MAKSALPLTRWEQFLPPPPSVAAQKRLLRVQRKIVARTKGPVICRGRDQAELAPLQCLERQFNVNCLGCPAPCHLCHVCRVKPLAFQDIELCRACLKVALKDEAVRGLPDILPTRKLYCQRTRVSIEYVDCVKLQLHQTPYEEECLFCPHPSYQCQRCRKYPSRYPNQGLCLHCMVAEYDGVVEDPKIEAFITRVQAMSQPRPVT